MNLSQKLDDELTGFLWLWVTPSLKGAYKNFDSEDAYISKYMFLLHFEDFVFESEGARRGFGVSSLKGTRKGANHCALVVNEFYQVQALFLL